MVSPFYRLAAWSFGVVAFLILVASIPNVVNRLTPRRPPSFAQLQAAPKVPELCTEGNPVAEEGWIPVLAFDSRVRLVMPVTVCIIPPPQGEELNPDEIQYLAGDGYATYRLQTWKAPAPLARMTDSETYALLEEKLKDLLGVKQLDPTRFERLERTLTTEGFPQLAFLYRSRAGAEVYHGRIVMLNTRGFTLFTTVLKSDERHVASGMELLTKSVTISVSPARSVRPSAGVPTSQAAPSDITR